jgi:hypothetical protein
MLAFLFVSKKKVMATHILLELIFAPIFLSACTIAALF